MKHRDDSVEINRVIDIVHSGGVIPYGRVRGGSGGIPSRGTMQLTPAIKVGQHIILTGRGVKRLK